MNTILKISAIAMALIVLSSCGLNTGNQSVSNMKLLEPQTTKNDIYGFAFEKAAETDKLLLEINPNTMDVRVTVKSTGYVWSTDKKSAKDNDAYPVFSLTYRDKLGAVGFMDSFTDSVSRGQYQAQTVENGVKVSYTLGKIVKQYIFPSILTPERYEMFYNRCNDDQKGLMDIVYRLIDFADYDEATAQEMRKKYPQAVGGRIYDLSNPSMNDSLKTDLASLLEDIGYTKEDQKIDGVTEQEKPADTPLFNISVIFTLENDTLVVRVPQESIQMSKETSLETLSLMQCFKGSEENDGYFLLPDGSGSIMRYKNGKVSKDNYTVPVYGRDRSITLDSEIYEHQDAALNIYGCREGKNAYLAVIEDSDAYATINATPGAEDQTPHVWPVFTVCPVDYMTSASKYAVQDDKKMAVHPTGRYMGNIQLRYAFLSGGDADYSGMAKWLRGYWLGDSSKEAGSAYPLTTELIGTVKTEDYLMGFRYRKNRVMTSFKQAEDIAKDLRSKVDALDVIYSGWANGGYLESGLQKSVKIEKDTGGSREFARLAQQLAEQKIGLYPSNNVQYDFSNHGQSQYAANKIDGSTAELYQYDLAVYHNTDPVGYILRSSAITNTIGNIRKLIQSKNIRTLALRGVGSDLNSDYSEKRFVDRQSAAAQMVGNLKQLKKDGMSVLTNKGNAYCLPYVDKLVDLPLRSDRYESTDYSVPFMAMVLSGHVSYTSSPVNLSNDNVLDLLHIIENGAAPCYVLTAESGVQAGTGGFADLYASLYSAQKQKLADEYAYLKDAVGGFYGQTILRHEKLVDNVFKTEFANGWVIVNYGDRDVTVNGIRVKAAGYVKGGVN